jgi:type I restriction-modification system DNA methylase subunit
MSETERLTKLRRQEEEVRDYPKSSRWYTGTGLAIKYLELAETGTTPAEVFRNSWYAIYNLYMMIHKRGESENIALSDWIVEARASQKVRTIALGTPTAFFEALVRAQNSLLFDAESKKPRDAKRLTDQWLFARKQNKELSPDNASTYLLLIGRDLRNAISHPKQDPNSPAIKKALKLAGEIFLPLAVAATEAMIERPPDGTTGRVTAYRSFLYPFLKNSDSPFSDYYLEKLFEEQELAAFPEDEAKTGLKEINKELAARRKDLVRADVEETLQGWCDPVLFPKLGLAAERGAKLVTDDGVFEPTAVIKKVAAPRLRKEYKGKDAGHDLACLIEVLPWSTSLDAVSADEDSSGKTVMEVAQSALTRADVDWAILTNGQKLRLLSKTTAHKPRSFMEIDLTTISDRWVERNAQLAFRYLLGLCSGPSITEKDGQDRTRLERALRESERHGKEISDELKKNVFSALEELGEGFLTYMRSKPAELESWRKRRTPSLSTEEFLKSDELLTDIYHESLSLMYRLLFLFYAEGRDLLPMDDERYRDSYSLESIRDDIIATHDDPDPKSFFSPGAYDLWGRLQELFYAVDGGWQNIIPAYNGGLFDPEQHPFLETFKINDQQLAGAIDLLSRTRPGAVRGEGRKKVTYRDLDIRHLGSIYEGILEYHAEIADQEKVIVRRGTGGKAAEEYIAPAELSADEKKHLKVFREAVKEDEENLTLPRGCKVTGLVEPGEYYLIYGGRESKRKSSGSYYTPDYIVQYIVENTLGPLVRGETRLDPESGEAQPLSSDQILGLRVLDPAMGSGHFLVAATEYLARAYGAAFIREGKGKNSVMSDEDFVHYKRTIAERCIYGIDINEMAVELAKLSMWLFTMDKGRPLSFLNHHLKCGNALIGAWIRDLGSPPEDKRRDTRTGNLFELRFREAVPMMVNDVFGIVSKETLEIADVRAKKALDHAVDERRQPFRNIADIWVGLHFGEERADYNNLLLNVEQARYLSSAKAKAHNSFHWELEFPEVFFDGYGRHSSHPGFDAVIGNPPYGAFFPFEDRPVLKKFRPLATDKELESYWLFMHLAAFEVSSTFGGSSLVVPITWLSVPTVRSLRRRILTERHLDRITVMPKNAFHEAGVETAVYVALPLGADTIKIFREWNSDRHTEIAGSECLKNDDSKIIYWLDEPQLALMQKIQNTSSKLGDYAYVTSGYEAYVVGKGIDKNGKPFSKATIGEKIYHSTKPKPGYERDLSGGDIGRYTLQWNGSRWVKYGTWLSVPRNKAVFTKPRVLVQEITGDKGTVKATFTEEEFYFSRDILCILDPKPEVSLLAVLAILNSKMFYFYHNSRSAKSQKALFPKLLVGDIKDTPLPTSMFSSITGKPIIRELETLVKKRLEGSGDNREVEGRIDLTVFELFGLTASEVDVISRFYDSEINESED